MRSWETEVFGKPCHEDEPLRGKVISGNSSLPGAGPLSNVNILCKKGNFYSVFRAPAVSAGSQNNRTKIVILWSGIFCCPSDVFSIGSLYQLDWKNAPPLSYDNKISLQTLPKISFGQHHSWVRITQNVSNVSSRI